MSNVYQQKTFSPDDLFSTVSFGGGGGGARSRAATDYCGSKNSQWVPDHTWGSDISQACKIHDENYANGMNKVQADVQLVKDVYSECVDGGASPLVCAPTAVVYGVGVMVFGGGAYNAAQGR
jgi:hypothetical protein